MSKSIEFCKVCERPVARYKSDMGPGLPEGYYYVNTWFDTMKCVQKWKDRQP